LRITKQPDPSTIRPEPVLKESLKMLLDKWAKKEANYAYFAEQFRSIRQVLFIKA
jgi:SAC3 family protein LENG8/THP3